MKKGTKQFINDCIPPLLKQLYQRLVRGVGYFGDYLSWDEACRASSGYDSDLILQQVKEALLKVKTGEAVYERDSVLFDRIHYSWPLLAGLLWIASRNGNRLSLIDFGGSLGSSYFQNREFLSHLDELQWSIIEQEKFVQCGRESFADRQLRFYNTIEECMTERVTDAVLLSGVLPYLERPYDILTEIVERGFLYIIIDRTPFIERDEDRITVQKVPAEIYRASYPAWIFSREKFFAFFAAKYELTIEFDALAGAIPLGDDMARDEGFIFRRR